MNKNQFEPVWIKVERAKEHIRDLDLKISEFKNRHPYEFKRESDSGQGERVYSLKIHQCVPIAWGAILGDAIHNLRSALDILVYQFVVSNRHEPTTKTGFPISKDRKDFESKGPQKVRGAPSGVIALIEELRPYKGGTEVFWVLHKLDIADNTGFSFRSG